jgi:hypothetical protein
MTGTAKSKTPWHLWTVGIVGVLWNSFGCYDYFMSNTAGEPYFRQMGMTDAQIAHYVAMPSWMTGVWAVGVWGAMLGSLLLLLRSRWAVEVFLASLVAYVVSLIYAYFISPAPGNSGAMMAIQAVIFAGCVFFLRYAIGQRKAGRLR